MAIIPITSNDTAPESPVEDQESQISQSPSDCSDEMAHSDSRSEVEPKPCGAKFVLPEVTLINRHADEARKLRVTVIGAGIAGIIAGALLPAKVPGIELTIFEKNADVGGVWFENTYPGVRCDVPAHVYQTSFSPNTQWSEEYAQGPEIRKYWSDVSRKHNVYQYLRLSHQVQSLDWDDEKSIWLVKVCNLMSGDVSIHEADFVLTAIGRFNDWRLPNYPGIKDYKGLFRHTSNWDPTFDVSNKRVAVIGNGASGIQLVPHLQKKVAHLDHYARSKTWIAESWGGESTKIERKLISQELRDSFKDINVYLQYRKQLEQSHWRFYHGWLRDSKANKDAREAIVKHMGARLARRPELIDKMIPEFSPHCRRLTPGPGYLEAIMQDNLSYIQTPIKRFTETGIETTDGVHREVDAIFAATGANTDVLPPFPITAKGKSIADLWSPDGEYGFPYSYLGFATPGFPNLGFIQGPNGAGRSGTVPHNVEVQVTYFAKILRKFGREGIKTMQPSKRAADDFVQYSDAFFKKTVMSECQSWYNNEDPSARVHGLWPGSAALVSLVVNNPRWEDWEYEYLTDSGNSLLAYFGNGCTRFESNPGYDVTSYLVDPAGIDLRKIHEGWWDIP